MFVIMNELCPGDVLGVAALLDLVLELTTFAGLFHTLDGFVNVAHFGDRGIGCCWGGGRLPYMTICLLTQLRLERTLLHLKKLTQLLMLIL